MKKCIVCKKEKPLNSFYKDSSRIDGYEYKCKECRAIVKKDTRGKVSKLIRSRKESSGCCICGYNRCYAALDFHHIDEGNKRFNVSLTSRMASLKNVEEEANKCILVCRNCHAEIHQGLISKGAIDLILSKQGTFSLTGQLYFGFGEAK